MVPHKIGGQIVGKKSARVVQFAFAKANPDGCAGPICASAFKITVLMEISKGSERGSGIKLAETLWGCRDRWDEK